MVEVEWIKYVEEIEELKMIVENFMVKCFIVVFNFLIFFIYFVYFVLIIVMM